MPDQLNPDFVTYQRCNPGSRPRFLTFIDDGRRDFLPTFFSAETEQESKHFAKQFFERHRAKISARVASRKAAVEKTKRKKREAASKC